MSPSSIFLSFIISVILIIPSSLLPLPLYILIYFLLSYYDITGIVLILDSCSIFICSYSTPDLIPSRTFESNIPSTPDLVLRIWLRYTVGALFSSWMLSIAGRRSEGSMKCCTACTNRFYGARCRLPCPTSPTPPCPTPPTPPCPTSPTPPYPTSHDVTNTLMTSLILS